LIDPCPAPPIRGVATHGKTGISIFLNAELSVAFSKCYGYTGFFCPPRLISRTKIYTTMVKSRRMKVLGEEMTKAAIESVNQNEMLKKASKKGYTAKVDFLLRNLKLTDAMDLFKDYKDVIKFIDDRYSNPSSRKAYYTAVISLAKHSNLPVDMDGHEALYNRMMESAKESDKIAAQSQPKVAGIKIGGKAVAWKDVVDVGEKLRSEDIGSPDALLVSIYSLMPPRRLADFLNMQIYKTDKAFSTSNTENSLVVNTRNKNIMLYVRDYKTVGTYGTWTKKITGVLFKCIMKSLTERPRKYLFENSKGESYQSSSFSRYVSDTFKRHLGVGLGVTDLRHLFVTFTLSKNPSMHERRRVADEMGHSTELQSMYNIATNEIQHAANEARHNATLATIKESRKKIDDLLKSITEISQIPTVRGQIDEVVVELFKSVDSLAGIK
jgi:uncharacterized protein YlxP (DUF503 family)